MNIFNKVALQGLKKNRTRTFVTVIGVALSSALITAVACFTVSLQDYMINGAISKYGNWHVEIPDTNVSFVQDQAENGSVVESLYIKNIGYSILEGGQNPDKPYLFISGWNEKALNTLPIQLLSGRLPENENEVVVPAHIDANGGVQISIGDTLTLSVGNRMKGNEKLSQHDPYSHEEEELIPTAEKTYTVVGICQRPAVEEFTAPGYTLITKTDAVLDDDSLTAFFTLENPYGLHSYIKKSLQGTDYILNNDVLRFMGLSGERFILILLCSIGVILVSLVMLGSVFLIYNSFNISLNERTHQFGILMSVGATEKQLRHSVLFEGLCIGVLGIPLGILTGIPLIKVVLAFVENNFRNVMYGDVPLSLKISVPALAAAVLVSMVTILISAHIPAKKAARMSIMECIRQTNEIKVEAKAVKTSKFTELFYGLYGMLALKNFKRNKRRYRSIILSLTLSVILTIGSSSFVTYLNQTAESSSPVVEDYDICFHSRDIGEADLFSLYDNMKNVTGVTKSSYQALCSYPCTLNVSDLSEHFLEECGEAVGYDPIKDTIDIQLDVQFVEASVYQDLLAKLELSPEKYSGKGENMIMAGMLPEKYYVQEEPMEFTIRSGSGNDSKTVFATFVQDYPDMLPSDANEWIGYSLMLIAPYEAKEQFDALNAEIKPPKLGMTFESENPGQSVTAMKNIIEGSGITSYYNLYNVYGILEQNRNLNFIVSLFSIVFIGMISLIAVANVFNTISTNIRLRRQELAMLRSVGMSDRDFNKMMRFECVLYGSKTLLFGLPIALLLSYLIYLGINWGTIEGNTTFVFPWRSMAVSIAGTFLIVFITMLYTTSKIKKENIIDALRDEMT